MPKIMLDKSIKAFKDHMSSILDDPVVIGWPTDGSKSVHVIVYSVSEDVVLRNRVGTQDEIEIPLVISVLIFTNPENEYAIIDKVIQGLRQNPIFETEGARNNISPDGIRAEEIAQIFIALNQPYQLCLPYKIRSHSTKPLTSAPLE